VDTRLPSLVSEAAYRRKTFPAPLGEPEYDNQTYTQRTCEKSWTLPSAT